MTINRTTMSEIGISNHNVHLINGIKFESDGNQTTMMKWDLELDSPIQFMRPYHPKN